jgi:transcriptional regulator GlxA family with amidase domain
MPKTNIVFLILPYIHLLDLAGADQVFLEALDCDADLHVEYCTFSENIETSSHLPFGAIRHFSEIHCEKGDYLIIPGADMGYLLSAEFAAQLDVFSWLKMAHEREVFICSICTGSFVLALAGLLDNKKCTTHWKRTAELQAKFPKTQVLENILFTEDDRILTSAGVTSGIDLALYIVSRMKDDLFSYKVARELVVYMRRQGHHAQQSVYLLYRNHIHSGIHKVQDYLQENIDKKASLNDLADIACMSTRNLTRIFKKETQISVNEFTNLIRKEKIKELVKNPDISRGQIARECGLKSERQVFRLM